MGGFLMSVGNYTPTPSMLANGRPYLQLVSISKINAWY